MFERGAHGVAVAAVASCCTPFARVAQFLKKMRQWIVGDATILSKHPSLLAKMKRGAPLSEKRNIERRIEQVEGDIFEGQLPLFLY